MNATKASCHAVIVKTVEGMSVPKTIKTSLTIKAENQMCNNMNDN